MPRSRTSALVGLVVIVAMLAVGVSVMLPARDGGLATQAPTGTPAALTAPTATGTPGVKHVSPASSLPAMLDLAPDWLGSSNLPMSDVARYADLAAASRQAGLLWPLTAASPDFTRWDALLSTLALPTVLASRGLDPVWQQTYGFSLLDVDQVLAVGQAPDYVTILRGRFDARTLHDAWVRSGYQAIEAEGVTAWSLFPGDSIDLSAPASRPAMATLNNVALLPDGTLVVATKLSSLKDVLKVVQGKASSLAKNSDVAALLTPVSLAESFVSAVLVKGQLLEAAAPQGTPPASPPSTMAAAPTSAATPPPGLGKVRLALFGIPSPATNGGTPAPASSVAPPGMVMLLQFGGKDDAGRALTVIQQRLASGVSDVTGKPYADRVRPVTIQRDPATPVVRMDLRLTHGAADWLSIIEDRDLGFAMWTTGSG